MDQIGRYKIEAEIGRGGFGRVYRAFDPNFGRLVAIKVLNAGADKDLLTRFKNEAVAVGKLQHKNIVVVHDFGQIGDTPYLVMEYLEGKDLQKTLQSKRPMDMLEKITIMDQVAAGLHHAHRNGIVHRDVKPANIMILKDGSVKIMDFGIARLMQDRGTRLTQHGNVIGTIQYMAPEQFQGGDVDALCDVFAYGVIYYELIAGQHPFDAPDTRRIFYNITMINPPPVASLAAECPVALERIVSKTLSKDRELRYQSLDDILFDVAPIRLELERGQAQSLVAKAEQLFSENRIAEAQQVIREALQFDANSEGVRQVRLKIQRHAELLASREKSRQLIEAARKDFSAREFDKALERLEAAQRIDSENRDLIKLIAAVRAEMEKAERAAALLAKAHREFESRDLTGAYQDVLDCLRYQPDSKDANALLTSIRSEIERRERERRFAETISKVEAQASAGDYGQALKLLRDLEISYPEHQKVQNLLRTITAAQQEQERKERLARVVEEARKMVSEARWQDAIAVLNRVAQDQPVEPAVHSLLAYCREELRAQEKAADIEQTVREARDLTEALDFERALGRINRALSAYPGESVLEAALSRTTAARIAHERDHERDKAVEAALADVSKHLAAGRTYEADALIRKLLARYTGDPRLTEMLETIEARVAEDARVSRIAEAEKQANQLAGRSEFDRALEVLQSAEQELGKRAFEKLRSEIQAKLEEHRRSQAINSILGNATLLVQQSDFKPALKTIEQALNEFPNEPRLTALRSRAAAEQEIFDRKRGIRIALERARELQGKGQLGKAEEALKQALHTLPNEPELLSELATIQNRAAGARFISEAESLIDKGSVQKARETIDRAAKLVPDDPHLPELRARLGAIQAEQERRERVAAALAEARKLLDADRPDNAAAFLKSALDRDPADLQLLSMYAFAEDTAQAKRRTQDIEERVRHGRDLIHAGRAEDAIGVLSHALSLHPGEATLFALLERARQLKEEQRQAAIEAEAARKRAQRNREIDQLVQQATRQAKRGNHEAAIKLLETEIRKEEDDRLRVALADIEKEKKQIEEQIEKQKEEHERSKAAATAVSGNGVSTLPKSAPPPPDVAGEPEAFPKRAWAAPDVVQPRAAALALPRKMIWAAGAGAAVVVIALIVSRQGTSPEKQPEPAPSKPRSSAPVTLPAKILKFTPNRTSVAAGQPVEVCYGVENATSLRLEPAVERIAPAHSRCFSFTPKAAGEYKLIATGTDGTVSARSFRLEITDAPAVKPGTLLVHVPEDGATVLINGRGYAVVSSKMLRVPLERGEYTVGVEKQGFTPAATQIARIEPDKTQELSFRLVPAPKMTVPTPPPETVSKPPEAQKELPSAPVITAAKRWEQLQSSRDIAVLEEFRRSNPGQYGDNAARRIEQLEWEHTRGANNVSAVRAFLEKYPSGANAKEARHILQQFEEQAAQETAKLELAKRQAADQRSIAETLRRLEDAYASRNAGTVEAVWPGAPRALRNLFKDAKAIEMSLRPVGAPVISGDVATVVCQRSVTTTFSNDRRTEPAVERITIRLQRSRSGWTIVSID
jgi:eukaryotic-like serine/threonine-protein kinase